MTLSVSSPDLLHAWLAEGWKFRGIQDPDGSYRARLDREGGLILEKDLADFFLATSDLVRWSKNQGIAVGPARGSAAASLACYLLRITEIDPLKYPQMLLERFLDPSRADMPDVDLDFEDARRGEVETYLAGKYGADCVGHLANFTRYRGKNALNDVARVYNIPDRAVAAVSELVAVRPDGDPRQAMALADAATAFPAARKVFEQHPDLAYALRLEGNLRELGTHAAGIVVASEPLEEFCAMYLRSSGSGARKREISVMAADKWGVEYLGALKWDILGLKTMTMLADACREAGISVSDLYALEPDDPEILASFGSDSLTGVFQFEGRATRTVCEKVKPRTFMELADITALSRPGCMASGTTTEYIKAGRDGWKRGAHTPLGKILADTRGQMVYQEQLLAIVRDIGGFDWAGASRVRKIVSKKLGGGQLAKEYAAFAEGAARLHGMREEQARAIWRRMEASASYLFNVAHSVSYAMLAYWSMWMKVYYPGPFFKASLLTAGDGKDDKPRVAGLIRDARHAGINAEPPELRNAGISWTLDPGDWAHDPRILAGLSQIPGIGEKTAQAILDWRHALTGSVLGWKDVIGVPGIGPVSHAKILDFVQSSDPFGVDKAAEIVGEIREAIKAGQLRMPYPRYSALAVAETRPKSPLCWAGLVRKIEYRDIIEDERARTGESIEQIRSRIDAPDLQKSATLKCEDEQGEVWIRFNRWTFPKFAAKISTIVQNVDAVVVSGKRTQGMGAAIAADRMWVVEP
jgi:DNA polymerase-3 subunit alpha